MRNNIHSSTSSGLAIEGDNGNLLHFIHDIDNSNLVNGKPVLYLIGHSNEVIGPSQEIGYLGLVNCDNILVENLVFARRENNRNLSGILMANTQNSRVENCAFENNNYGIYITCGSNNNILTHNSVDNNATGIDILFSSDNNIIEYNTITQNRVYGVLFYQYFVGPEIKPAGLNNTIRNNNVTLNNRGIYIPDSNENNRIYHNNFEISTLYQAYDNGSNYWDDGYPSGGNHWSDYAGVDDYSGENQDIPGSDGIGDTPYYITGDNNQDRYPLMTLAPCTGTASIRLATGTAPFLWGIRKVKTTENLVVNTGDNLRLIFLAYNNVTVESEDVIWSRTAIGTQIVNLTDLIVSHDNSLTWPAGDSPSIALAMPAGNVKRVKLILTDSAGNVIVDNMAWYTVVQDDWSNRISWIILNWASHSSPQQDQLSNEISTIILSWAGVPTVRDQHDFSQL
jgi:parallel beta-helix repeat protein